ncbi:hypothetical protein ES703_111553 [subsurface metagenome]
MAKHRPGLHKEISSIFGGVPIPKSDGTPQPSSEPEPDLTGHESHTTANKRQLESPEPEKQEQSVGVGDTAPPPEPERPAEAAPKPAPPPEPKWPAEPAPRPAKPEPPKVEARPKAAGPNPLQKIWQQIESRLLAPKPGVNPARQKATVVLIPVLFITMIFTLFQVFGAAPQKTKGAMQDDAVNISSASSSKIDWQIPDPYPPTLRDPMRFTPMATAGVETGKLIVTSILYDKENPSARSATVSNQIVYEGEKVMGATVVKINSNNVEFELNGRKWTQRVQ